MLPMDYVATFISSYSFHLAFHGVYMYGISLDGFLQPGYLHAFPFQMGSGHPDLSES